MTNLVPQLVGRDGWGALLSAPADGHHFVHFYEGDEYLFDVVGKFLGSGLDAGDRLIVIATPEHQSGFTQWLQDWNVDRALAEGRLLLLDARETLARFMVNGRPDPGRFHCVLEDALTRVSGDPKGVRVRAYGEMVDLLWRDGDRTAAIALEELWNEASSRHAFSLLCAYVMANFYKAADEPSFTDVCRTHSHVLPTDVGSRSDAAPSGRGTSFQVNGCSQDAGLRKRLRSAELEIERLREIERALRESASDQRRAAREALLASEARFHHLVDAVTDYAIFMLDSDGSVATWNPGAVKIKGYSQEEILGQHFSIFYTAEDRRAGKPQHILETVRREGRFEDESWRVRKDGSRFWANVVITALRGPKNEITGFAKVTRDLTTKREAEEKARELAREQMARAASERASRELARLNRVGALFIADSSSLETVLSEIVEGAIEIAGADFGNIQLTTPDGSHLRIGAHRGLPEWWLDFWNSVPSHEDSCGTAFERKERVVVEDVERSPIFAGTLALGVQRRAGVRAFISTPIVSRSGRRLGMISTHYRAPHKPEERTLQMLDVLARQTADILDRSRADTEDAAMRRQLEQANRAKDDFVATLSHELRTPLNAMLGWASLLRRGHQDPAKLERGLEVIERNVRAQTRLVDDLLDVSRIINGKLRLSMQKTEVSAVIWAAADVVRPAADARHVRLVLDVDPDVGTMLADPERLQQIVWNLLSNAVRFTPAGGCVAVTAHREDSQITICVQDTGSGIASEHLPHIFERFRQIDSSTTRSHGGLGLGLAIVRHLVEAHGGSVSAASEGLGRGAAFTVHLPIVAAAAPGLEAASDRKEESARATTRANLSNLHVLVVDADAAAMNLLRLVLEEAGAEVSTARSALAALELRGPFDLIISDIGMPEMDGHALVRSIRASASGAHTPAIALTAHARPEDSDRAARSGYQQHFVKPVDPAALMDAVLRWTGRTESVDEHSARA